MTRIKLSEYSQLNEEGKAAKLEEISRSQQQPPNGQIEYLNEKISEYETTYEMSSEAMVEAVKNRTMKETADICSWIMLVNVRNELST